MYMYYMYNKERLQNFREDKNGSVGHLLGKPWPNQNLVSPSYDVRVIIALLILNQN